MPIEESDSTSITVGHSTVIWPETMPLPLFKPIPGTPFGVRSYGPVSCGGLLVFVWSDTLEAILRHGKSDLVNEVGGWLLGRYAQDGIQPFVIVEASLPADGAGKSPVGFNFTVDDQIQMSEVREKHYSHLLVVGWYHSHPLGLRLSDTDKAAHRGVFREEFQIAMVMSTGGRDVGCAVWENGEISKVRGFFVLDKQS